MQPQGGHRAGVGGAGTVRGTYARGVGLVQVGLSDAVLELPDPEIVFLERGVVPLLGHVCSPERRLEWWRCVVADHVGLVR